MAWLQNLAGKAENLLVKFDENAANVFNESNLKHLGLESPHFESSKNVDSTAEVSITIDKNPSNVQSSTNEYGLSQLGDIVKVVNEKTCPSDGEDSGVLHNKPETPSPTSHVMSADTSRKELKSEGSAVSSKSGSLQNSFIFMDDTLIKYEDKIGKLEHENEELNQQLINMRHMYCELQNENSNLQSQLERTSETLLATQSEMEQYRARAQRILQEKEKLIRLKQDDPGETNELIFNNYNEELRKELKFQEEKNFELADKLSKVNHELTLLQQNFILTQKESHTAKQVLQDSLMREKKIRSVADEECRAKSKELQSRLQEIGHQNSIIASKSQKILQLEAQLKQKYNPGIGSEVEERIQSLTQTLMSKQSSLETVMSERNALRLQLQKLENEYQRSQSQRTVVRSSHLTDADEGKTPVPQFFQLSPFDIGVTRKVKRAYSTLDAISIRVGVFLRRYPIARLFVFCYIVMLHIWVLFILFTYIPSTTR
ncbi:hypothetical protein PPYR_05581 [Photinus pyralis]|uniref:Uncharacterized protein n=1 Tax=Photinus pyralis TaxID=7054 RepID=A0A1Y1JZX9_PHOPY|nr:golgin-84 [Photinus pyralis]KAB0801227.1 hypothetical protein PPYR_05581 [Photinus pyralis]